MTDKLQEVVEQKLGELRRAHHYCEDTWYSCPKHPDGCANEHAGEECDCGADAHNQRVDDLRAFLAQYVLCERDAITWLYPDGEWLEERYSWQKTEMHTVPLHVPAAPKEEA